MSTEKIAEAIKDGLTPKKIVTARQNAFEFGAEVFIEDAGLNKEAAAEFRDIMIHQLQADAAAPAQ